MVKSDTFWPLDIQSVLKWILKDEENGHIFGISRNLFFIPGSADPFQMCRYGEILETPLGVAAGPHTQLCQNIVSVWLTGARYIELKTVQVLDQIEVTKPCIDMTDEGYNCEWSQELSLRQSFDEYLNAWIIIHVLKDRFGWGSVSQRGFIFNMSVGYNMDGILKPAVQLFLEKMQHCPEEKAIKVEQLAGFYPRVKELDIPDFVSKSVTISTMHGCPPDEVEKIGRYFVESQKLDTTIKLNPTLLGPENVRRILNDEMGFAIKVPDLAFEHDLKYIDALSLIRSLQKSSEESGVAFNIKLTNTLETVKKEQYLPKTEKMAYMSGRALHPISINLAASLQAEFNGELDISFSAGADCFNFISILGCNLKPVTVCSDILKPGGYGRLSQYLEEARKTFHAVGAKTLDEYVLAKGDSSAVGEAALKTLTLYARAVREQYKYRKEQFPYTNIKTDRSLTTFDCIQAPCTAACPAGQDIPLYMQYTANGDYQSARCVIGDTNPLPTIQGMVCDHLCETKCTRINYDNPLKMREIKRFIMNRFNGTSEKYPVSNGARIAIIGAGPSGLSCAYFLSRYGFETHVFEEKSFPGGWASDAIPEFRLDRKSVQKDIESILESGVNLHLNSKIDRDKFASLRKTFNCIYIAVGAQHPILLGIPGEDIPGVIDQLTFLSDVRRGNIPDLGKNIVVIGGGNSAIDAARTAGRLVGSGGDVVLLYRRSRKEMPAAPEEIQAMLEEKISLMELVIPESISGDSGKAKSIVCSRAKLGPNDESGRGRPIKIAGSRFELKADTVISALGQRVDLDFLLGDEVRHINPDTYETGLPNVFIGGDAIRGASTMINAIADGKKVAVLIADRLRSKTAQLPEKRPGRGGLMELMDRKARRQFGPVIPEIAASCRAGFDLVVQTLDEAAAREEAGRCLRCDQLCWICVTVCPNRANVGYTVEPCEVIIPGIKRVNGVTEIIELGRLSVSQEPQVINIGDFCNECGNCTIFCPTSGSPYLEKPRFYIAPEAFAQAVTGYRFVSPDRLEYKFNGHTDSIIGRPDGDFTFENDLVRVQMNKNYEVYAVEVKSDGAMLIGLKRALRMAILYSGLHGREPLMQG